MTDELYVHEGAEVILTGRKAQRTLKNKKVVELLEIKPKGLDLGSWTKWVKEIDLYKIQ